MQPPPAPQPAAGGDLERLTWGETRRLIRSDFARLAEWYGGGSLVHRIGWFVQPNYQCMFLYRIYRYLYVNHWRASARALATFAVYLTGVEISPTASIGPGCLVAHAFGVIIFGKIGARFSIFGQSGLGGGFGEKDIGGGPGYPVVGDDVVFGVRSMALGSIRIGNRVKVSPGAFVNCDVPDDALVLSVPSKVIKVQMSTEPRAGAESAP